MRPVRYQIEPSMFTGEGLKEEIITRATILIGICLNNRFAEFGRCWVNFHNDLRDVANFDFLGFDVGYAGHVVVSETMVSFCEGFKLVVG